MKTENSLVPPLANTGERLMTDNQTETAIEHLHRYALACGLATGLDVLDIACGEGYGSNLLAGCAKSVVGVDVAADSVAHAAAKYRRHNLRYAHGSATAVPLPDAAVDLVVSFETIEHLREHDEMLSELRRVLRPGGRVIISSPDRRYYSEAAGYTNPFHLRELSCEEFRELIARFFPHSRLFRQRIVKGSLIVPEGSIAGFCEYRGDFTGFRDHPLLHEAMYDVIVASDEPLPDWPLWLWDGMPASEPRLTVGGRRALARPATPSLSGSGSPLDAVLPGVLGQVAREVRRIFRQVSGT
jgi:SAM-dependent methyltransferase